MGYEEDFVKEDLVEFEIEGRKFKYKPVTAGEEVDWLQEYIKTGPDGKPQQDHAALNKLKTANILDVPYDAATIQGILKLKDPLNWEGLNKEQRWQLLRKLKPGMFDKIIKAIEQIDRPDETKKKS